MLGRIILIRKVRFPLKYKFVVVITALLLLTMGFYLNYALTIFKEDKAADVYSITLTNSVSVAERAKLLMNEDAQVLNGLQNLTSPEELNAKMVSLLAGEDAFLALSCLRDQDFLTEKNERKLEQLNAGPEAAMDSPAGVLRTLTEGEVRVDMNVIKNFPPHYTIFKGIDKSLRCAVHISFEKLMPLMNETLNYGTYLLTENGKLFFKLNNISESRDLASIARDKTIQDIQQGVKRFSGDNGAIIRAFSKVPGLGLIAITEIEESKAFLASRELIQKSFYFGILILSVAVVAGILFTKRMTRNVQTLFLATTEVAAGNFNVNPVAEGSDEIGALTDSFVDMKNKIVRFMEEMKEKARLENELKVAHLVQHSFFPKHAVIKTKYSFDGHYSPASECSGDWWGFFEQNKKTTIVVCDATGHGVPAALITAAAHSCVSTLKIDSEREYISPKTVLEKLNKVICSLNSEILMTAFALEIDEENNRLVYANASHMTPYLLQKTDNEYTKSGVVPLQDNNGKRLGENWESEYSENAQPLQTGDRVVLFSDGIIEMAVDGKAWGQRNFLKSLFKAAPKDASGMIDSVLEDFKGHAGEHALQDDITLVCVSVDLPRPVIESLEELKKNEAAVAQQPVVISKLSNEENICHLLPLQKVNHVIGFNTIDLGREAKFVEILESKSLFNLSDYINESYKKKLWSLISNKKIPNVIEELIENVKGDFEKDLTGAIQSDVLRLVSEELLSNAFYHSKGEDHPVKRGEEILLTPDQEVEFLFAANDEYVVIAVKGPTGISSKEKVLNSIKRGYKEKTPVDGENGAGLGLYMVYESCNQFWVINGGSKGGQIICVFEKFNRYKQARERITSFHFLAKEMTS